MGIIGIILVIFLIICLVAVFFDPLEKYDKNLDDPNYKKYEGAIHDLHGPWPQVTDKRKNRNQPHHLDRENTSIDEIEQFISDHRLPLYHQTMLNRKDAIKFLYLLKKHKRKLYGFDGFHLRTDISSKAIQIDQSYSRDYSQDSFDTSHEEAVEFFEKHHEEDIGYEFVYDKNENI